MFAVLVISGLVIFLAGFVVRHLVRKAREQALALEYLALVPMTGFIDLYELREMMAQKKGRSSVPYGETLLAMEWLRSMELVVGRNTGFAREVQVEIPGTRVPEYCLTPAGWQRQQQLIKAACA